MPESAATPESPQRDVSSKRQQRRRLALLAVTVVVVLLARPVWHLLRTRWADQDAPDVLPPGVIDDASRMNRTRVREIWSIPSDPAAAESQLAELLEQTEAQGIPVSIAGARHSMGGHTIAPDGVVIDMRPFNHMALDESRDVLTVGAGALWSEIIPFLDARGRSVGVMQSNNSFSVGGSISVNCHGWQFGRPPISSLVESIRLMQADGTIVRCSRLENAELFSLALGGYGLFGVILDVDMHVVPNERYHLQQVVVPLEQALPTFDEIVTDDPDLAMVYARMGIVPSEFLEEVIINVLRRDPAADGSLPPLTEPGLVGLRRSLFRGSVGSEYGKELRWAAETRLQPHLRNRYFSRNQLLSEGVDVFQGRSADDTDILHEYFVPRDGLIAFVESLRTIIPRHEADLLNITVRSIGTDVDTFLRYADGDVFSFVMLFSQSRNSAGDRAMEALTQELIDAILAADGRYYLCYRLHATSDQFHRAYPQAERFFELKREYDPQERFQNQFYQRYGGKR